MENVTEEEMEAGNEGDLDLKNGKENGSSEPKADSSSQGASG